ncbi:MAG: polyprenol monophosphomannose synthase [Bacteroidetes bacterium]|nr:polyprenol monophosphomannose synthase [Bacteroidota bacterium]
MDKLVIIPTYNEKENIVSIIEAVLSLPGYFHVLVVDDTSPDQTATLVKELCSSYPSRLFLEERKGKGGLGKAYIHGFRWALEKGYAFIFEMDADFSHNPKDLIRLHQACTIGQADVAIGSRYVKGGGVINWPFSRILLSKGASLYTRVLTKMKVKDPTAGFVCYRAAVLAEINLDLIRFVGYAFQIEMKYAVWKLGFSIKEVPIVFQDRTRGSSKMNKGIIKEGVVGVWLLSRYASSTDYRSAQPLH